MPTSTPVLRRTVCVLAWPCYAASIRCCLAIATPTVTPVLGRANFGLASPENISIDSPLIFACLLSCRIVVASILYSTPAIRYCYCQHSDRHVLIIVCSVDSCIIVDCGVGWDCRRCLSSMVITMPTNTPVLRHTFCWWRCAPSIYHCLAIATSIRC